MEGALLLQPLNRESSKENALFFIPTSLYIAIFM